MSLTGRMESGTPLETRGSATAAARLTQNLLQGGYENLINRLAGPLQRTSAASVQNILGLSPRILSGVYEDLLADPASMTEGLFASMVPFEQEEVARQTQAQRALFGTMGGRFSRNIGTAEANLRSRLSGEFQRNRQSALLTAQGQRIQAAGQASQAQLAAQQLVQQGILQQLQAILGYAQPGAPVYNPGILPSLLSAGATLGGALLPIGANKRDTSETP